MIGIERLLLSLYTLLLRLYPRQFQQDFAAEMQTVFGDALGAAHQDGLRAVLELCSREARGLPRALAREHWQAGREARMDKNMRFNVNSEAVHPTTGRRTPMHSWREVLLAILPLLLILLLEVTPKLLVGIGLLTFETTAMRLVNATLIILSAGAFLLVLYLAWRHQQQRQKWPVWLASWYPFLLLPLPLLAGWLLGLILKQESVQEVTFYLFVPFALAVLLYGVTRLDRLRGLLAALPVLYLLWGPNMEFVPDMLEAIIKICSTALACLAIAFILRRGAWREGLYAVLAMNLIVGVLFSYAGIYHGGSLPFVAPGPNLVEVARSLIPQYLAMSAILLGPLFAWRFRRTGLSGGWAGEMAYHLALTGLLIVILTNLASLMMTLQVSSPGLAKSAATMMAPLILVGMGIYLGCLVWLYRSTPSPRTASGWAERILLALLPLAIPVLFMLPFISWKWPVSNLYMIPLLWLLPHEVSLSLGLVWLALSVWLVTQGCESELAEQAPAEPARLEAI